MRAVILFIVIVAFAVLVATYVFPKKHAASDPQPWLRDPIVGRANMPNDCNEPTAPWKCDPIAPPKPELWKSAPTIGDTPKEACLPGDPKWKCAPLADQITPLQKPK
jgi:hypothetical protein